MTGPASAARIFLKRGATDMRKGYDGLSGLVREAFGREPTDGSLFVFVGRRRDDDPYAYLLDVMRRMPLLKTNEIGTLIPERWTTKASTPAAE